MRHVEWAGPITKGFTHCPFTKTQLCLRKLLSIQMGHDPITNPRAGGPAKALVDKHDTDTNPSLVYGTDGGFNYGLQPFEGRLAQPNPSTVYLEIDGLNLTSENYGQLLSGYIQNSWLPETQI